MPRYKRMVEKGFQYISSLPGQIHYNALKLLILPPDFFRPTFSFSLSDMEEHGRILGIIFRQINYILR